jgi:hypothetical protein
MSEMEEFYEVLGIKPGPGEKAFWNYQYKNKEDVPGLFKGNICTGFSDINKELIVKDKDAKAYQVVPNNYFLKQHKLVSFLKFDPENEEQVELLRDMIRTTLKNFNSDDLIMFFNVLKEKNTPSDKNHCMVMSVSYLHLWVIEKSRMYNDDKFFHQDANPDENPLFTEKEIKGLKDTISEIIRNYGGCSILENSNSKCFAPIHIKIKVNGNNEQEEILDTVIKTSKIIKDLDKNLYTKKIIDKGFRIMIRKNGNWSSNILTGGKLSTISKR